MVTPTGEEFAKFKPREYLDHISEHVETWSYIKFPFLKNVGWKGFVDGPDSGVFRVAPLARLNASEGMATPQAQTAHDEMYETLGGKPAHNTLAYHWARLVEILYAAERLGRAARGRRYHERQHPHASHRERRPRASASSKLRAERSSTTTRRTSAVSSRRRTSLLRPSTTRRPYACRSTAPPRVLIKDGVVNDGLLNMVEMAFRAYDPCFGCATHSMPGQMPLVVEIKDPEGNIVKRLSQFVDG